MEKFFNKMGKKIYKAIKKDAKRVLKEMDGEELYSVALVTDSDCITLFMALNTYEFLETADEEYLEMVKDDLSEEDMRQIEEGEVGSVSIRSFTPFFPPSYRFKTTFSAVGAKTRNVVASFDHSAPKFSSS